MPSLIARTTETLKKTLPLLLILILSGCTPPAPKSRTDAPIEIEFWTLQLLEFRDLLEPMFRRYEKTHPNVRIKWVDVPFSEGEKRTLTAMMSPDAPDVVNLNPDFSAILASRAALVDMATTVSPKDLATYVPVTVAAASLRRQNHDFIFGLPWYVTSSIGIYNGKLLRESGYAQPPTTFEQLPAFSRAIQKQGGFGLMPTVTENGNFLKELQKLGVTLYRNDRAVFADDPASVRHLARYIDLYKSGLIPADALTEGHRSAVDKFQSGQLAMLLSGPNFLNIIRENAPAVYRDVMVAPQFPPAAPYKDFSLMLLAVPEKSAHPKEAVDFALFMTNAANQMALAERAPVLPSVSAALQRPYFSGVDNPDLATRARAISAAQLLGARETYRIRPGQKQINEAINHYVQLAFLGKLGAAEALGEAQQEINAVLESNR